MKKVRPATLNDYPEWLKLAEEVEPLFGPMVHDPAFCNGLRKAVLEKNAFCCVTGCEDDGRDVSFHGGVLISREANEVLWLAVFQRSRGQGIGAALLSEAVRHLDHARPIVVTTFDPTIEAGTPARSLYRSAGFRDSTVAGRNPAGIPTVTMTLLPQNGLEGGGRNGD